MAPSSSQLAPKQADAAVFGNGLHWNCPNGVKLIMGGGSGYQFLLRQAAAWYNDLRAQQTPGGRQGWPAITSSVYAGSDGYASNSTRCTIDADEKRTLANNAAGEAFPSTIPWTNHIGGCSIYLAGAHYNGGSWEDAIPCATS